MKLNKALVTVICAFVALVGLSACSQSSVINLATGPEISKDYEQKLDEYAAILVKSALNVVPGETVVIQSGVENKYLAEKCLDKAYEAGAGDVRLWWNDAHENHERAKNSNSDTLKQNFINDYLMRNAYATDKLAFLNFDTFDPNANEGLTKDQTSKFSKAKSGASTDFVNKESSNKMQWVISVVPQENWAKMVFPKKSSTEAVTSLWSSIFEDCRITGDGKGIDRWNEHIQNLQDKAKMMTDYNFKTLHYTNDKGTDLTIDLPKDHVWVAGKNPTTYGVEFTPNVPTEEIFTSPIKNSANGKVYSSKPLVLGGELVEDFYFEVKDGKIVGIHAEKGEDLLKDAVEGDEGADYFGEIALVPYDSAISKQNLIYYHSLFDENASCHIAFGDSYPECLKGGLEMNDDQLVAAGLNQSKTHIDFMVGTQDLKIVGTTWDGKEIVIFENGNWA